MFFRFDDRLLLISIGALVGSCSGLAALALNRGLIAMFELLEHYRHLWWAFIMPGIGAAMSSLFLEKIIKEALREDLIFITHPLLKSVKKLNIQIIDLSTIPQIDMSPTGANFILLSNRK